MATTSQPRGVRNNNPGNVEWGQPWQGLIDRSKATDDRFAQFISPAYGIRVIARVLIGYQDNYGINTVKEAINRYAPPIENNTDAYIDAVCAKIGVDPDDPVSFQDYAVLRPCVEAIIKHENGVGPLSTANTWYDAQTIDEALKLAGVVKPVTHMLLTPQGAAAGAAATAGTVAAIGQVSTQIAPLLQQVQTASSATDGLPSWLRAVIIVGTLVAAAAGAWALWHESRKNTIVGAKQ